MQVTMLRRRRALVLFAGIATAAPLRARSAPGLVIDATAQPAPPADRDRG